MRPAPVRLPRVLWAPVLLLGIYVCGTTSVLFAPHGTDVAIWWPAAGLAVVLLVVHPRGRGWWLLVAAVTVVSGLANLTAGRGATVSIGFGLSNAAEAAAVALWLLSGVPGRRRLRTQDDLWRLLTGTVLGILVIGVGVALTVLVSRSGDVAAATSTVFLSHGAAILVIVPLALTQGLPTYSARFREKLAQVATLAATIALVFGPHEALGFSFVTMPVLVWAALRLGVRTIVWEMLALSVATTTLSSFGWGPFAVVPGGRVTSALATGPLVQAYLIACAVIVLPLAVAVEQRRSALAQVTASEELFRRSFTDSIVGMVLLRFADGRLRVIEANETAAGVLGATTDELEGADFEALLATPTDVGDVVAEILAGGRDGWREDLGLHRDPHVRLSISLSPLVGHDGSSPRFTVQMVDITAAHEATMRMRSEMDFTAAILDTTASLIVVVDVDGTVVGMNRAAQAVTGFTDDEVVDRPLWDLLIPPADRADVRRMYAEGNGRGIPVTHEADLATRSGRKRRVLWTSAFLTDHGHRTHVVMTGIDVTNERTSSLMLTHLMEAATTTAFVGCDLDGRVTVCNAGAQQMLGRRSEDVVGRPLVGSVLDPDEVGEVPLGHPSRPQTEDWTVTRGDGSTFTLSLTVTPVLDVTREHVGYLGVGKDVTEARRSEASLMAALDAERQAVEQLRSLDRAKDDFISTVSHELRTPITSIVGYVEMLQDGDAGALTAEQDRLVEVVRRNGERLISLAEDLLTLSSFETGTASLDRVLTDLRGVVHRAQEALRPLLAARGLDVVFEVPADAVTVSGDAGHLERVVFNLVSNAVKFTEDGGRVRCALGTEGADAVLQVSDTGIGIPVEEQG
ncbi:MAG: PAS domain S-box protein, partial [Actinomycetes bacterium]